MSSFPSEPFWAYILLNHVEYISYRTFLNTYPSEPIWVQFLQNHFEHISYWTMLNTYPTEPFWIHFLQNHFEHISYRTMLNTYPTEPSYRRHLEYNSFRTHLKYKPQDHLRVNKIYIMSLFKHVHNTLRCKKNYRCRSWEHEHGHTSYAVGQQSTWFNCSSMGSCYTQGRLRDAVTLK